MKDKYKRIMATGLLALMLASYTACDETNSPVTIDPNDNQITQPTQPNQPDISLPGDNTDITKPNPEPEVHPLSGSVWDAIKDKPEMQYDSIPEDVEYELEHQPIPITFLQEQGIVCYDKNKKLDITDALNASEVYDPFAVRVFTDSNTTDNDVYVLMQYTNGMLKDITASDKVTVATWMLKYNLDDNDYRTLQNLNGDFRSRYFIQEMDKQYEPQIIHKGVTRHNLIYEIGSYTRDDKRSKWGFPYVFIANVDFDNLIVTYGGVTDTDIRYYDVDIRDTDAWEKVISIDGMTEEQRDKNIVMKSLESHFGRCLSQFRIGRWSVSFTDKQAQEAFDNTDNIMELQQIDVNTNQKEYVVEQ